MRPGNPAVCSGIVMHHRHRPVDHRFTYPVTHVWLDPDRGDGLCANHPLWSARRPAPVTFRRRDYFDSSGRPIGPGLRQLAAEASGHVPSGPIRALTQPRTWGWLFNPITIYLLWPGPDDRWQPGDGAAGPVVAVLEVTNTPWKERHHYAVALEPVTLDPDTGRDQPPEPGVRPWPRGATVYRSTFAKALHVSPFLDEDYRYALTVGEPSLPPGPAGRDPVRRLRVDLDVVDRRIRHGAGDGGQPEAASVVLTTRLVVDLRPATRANMTQALLHNPFPTHRVSAGIHRQAAELWRKGAGFVAHPRRRSAPAGHLDPGRPAVSEPAGASR